MATEKIIGQIKFLTGLVQIVGIDGVVRDALTGAFIYEGEKIVSVDSDAIFTVKYSGLTEESTYEGIFTVLVDASVIAEADSLENIMSDENLFEISKEETAAGEEAESNSGYFPDDDVAASNIHIQGFSQGTNSGLNSLGGIGGAGLFLDDLNDFAPTAENATNIGIEDSPADVRGQLVGHDLDGNPFHFVLVDGPSEGSVSINLDGTYAYNVKGDFQDLAEGETRDVTFTYKTVETYTPEGYESEPATVTITVTGTNDQPVVSNVDANVGQNDIVGLDATNNDANASSDLSNFAQKFNAEYSFLSNMNIEFADNQLGSFKLEIINNDGESVYTSNIVNVDTASNDGIISIDTDAILTVGNTYTINFIDITGDLQVQYSVSDNTNDGLGLLYTDGNLYDGVDVNIKLTYNNAYESNGQETIFDGQLTLTEDLDTTDTHTFSQSGTAAVITNSTAVVTGLSVAVEADGTYSVDGNFDALADGEFATVTFDYVAIDDSGAANNTSEPKTVTLTVSGTNDRPIVSDVSIEESDSDVSIASGRLELTEDLDTTDAYTFSQVGTATVVTTAGGVVTGLSVLVKENGDYTVDGDFSGLSHAEKATVTFDYVAIDDSGAYNDTSAPKTVTLTVIGENFQPIVSDVSLSVDETDANLPLTSGRLAITTDLDATDTHTFAKSGTEAVVYSEALVTDLSVVVAETGDYAVYGNFDALAVGEKATVTFDYVAIDDSGALDATSEPKTVTLTVNGTNDQPIVSDVSITANESNGLERIATGTLVLTTDLDTTDGNHTFSQSGTAAVITNSAAVVTDLSVVVQANGTYSVDGNFDALAEGEIATVTFDYVAIDDSGAANNTSEPKTVTLTVTGTNDVPVVSDISTFGIAGSSVNISTNSLEVHDLDTTDTHTFIQQGTNYQSNQNATIAINTDPKYITYTPANGFSGSDTFTYAVTDSHGGEASANMNIDVEKVANNLNLAYVIDSGDDINQIKVTVTATKTALSNGLYDTNDISMGIRGIPSYATIESKPLVQSGNESTQDFIITLPRNEASSFDITVFGASENTSTGDKAYAKLNDSIDYNTNLSHLEPTFEAKDQSMWSSGDAFVIENNSFLGVEGNKNSNSGSVFYSDYNIDYKLGLQSDLKIQSGTVDASVPYSIDIDAFYNETTDYLRLESSSLVNLEDSYFNTFSPGIDYSLNLITDMAADLEFGVDIPVPSIPGYDVPDFIWVPTPKWDDPLDGHWTGGFHVDEITFPNITESADTNFAFDNSVELLHFDANSLDLFGLEGDIRLRLEKGFGFLEAKIPQYDTESIISGDQLVSTGSDIFFTLGVDVDEMLSNLTGLPNPFGESIELYNSGISVGYDLANYELRGNIGVGQDFSMDFGNVDATITFEDNIQTDFTLGDTLDFSNVSAHDANNDGDIDYSVSLTPDINFSNDLFLTLDLSHVLELFKAYATSPILEYDLGPVFKFPGTLASTDIPLYDVPDFNFDIGTVDQTYVV